MKRWGSVALAVLMLTGCNEDEPGAPTGADPIAILKAAHVRDIATALTAAYEQFSDRNFDACIAFCQYVLSREPGYCVAVELAEDAEKVKSRDEYYDFLRAKVENWKKLTNVDEATIPYVGGDMGYVLTYPHLGLPGTDSSRP